MENEKIALEIQLKETYGRITHSYIMHIKKMNALIKENKLLKYLHISLSAIITGGCLGAFTNHNLAILSAIFSTLSLGLNLYFKDFNLAEEAKNHQIASNELWLVKEKYINLLTDLEKLTINEIIKKRDQLMHETYEIYINAPKIENKDLVEIKEALKYGEFNLFTERDLENILPEYLRKTNIEN